MEKNVLFPLSSDNFDICFQVLFITTQCKNLKANTMYLLEKVTLCNCFS